MQVLVIIFLLVKIGMWSSCRYASTKYVKLIVSIYFRFFNYNNHNVGVAGMSNLLQGLIFAFPLVTNYIVEASVLAFAMPELHVFAFLLMKNCNMEAAVPIARVSIVKIFLSNIFSAILAFLISKIAI